MYEQRQFGNALRLAARATGVVALAAVVAGMIAGCGAGGGGAPWSPVGLIDQAARTVQLSFIINRAGFDGYSGGQMTVRVPRGWRVDVYCSNQSPARHSCAVVSSVGSTSPAFPGAASPRPLAGLGVGASTNFSFIVKTVGSYRLAFLVPDRQDRTMWEHFDVVASGKPSASTAPQPARELVRNVTQARRNS